MKKASALLFTLIACSCTHHSDTIPFSITTDASGINPFYLALVVLWGSFAIGAYVYFRRGGPLNQTLTANVMRQSATLDRKLGYAFAIMLSVMYGVMLGTTTYFCPQKVADLLVPITLLFSSFMVVGGVLAVKSRTRTEEKIRLWRFYFIVLISFTVAGLITTAWL